MFIADKTEKRCLVACDEQTKKDGRCTCLSKNADTQQLLQTAVSRQSEQLPCRHQNIMRQDGLDECLDCGAKNY